MEIETKVGKQKIKKEMMEKKNEKKRKQKI